MDGWMDRQIDRYVDRWMGGRTDSSMDARTGRWTSRKTEKQTNVRMIGINQPWQSFVTRWNNSRRTAGTFGKPISTRTRVCVCVAEVWSTLGQQSLSRCKRLRGLFSPWRRIIAHTINWCGKHRATFRCLSLYACHAFCSPAALAGHFLWLL
jgi:hypothetical protein